MINACDLRQKDNLLKIEKKAGFYKWYAEKAELNFILQKLGVSFADIQSALEIKNNLYCIYVGIAAKESVRERLNWHINQKHTESNVRHGTLSTLRQSIASIVSQRQGDEKSTNHFIDKLKLEYFVVDDAIKSENAQKNLIQTEEDLMKNHLYVLNIQKNYHPLASPIRKKLKQLRKISKVF